jgi:hypothetical protein
LGIPVELGQALDLDIGHPVRRLDASDTVKWNANFGSSPALRDA